MTSLHFSLRTIQSRMDARNPIALKLEYTRLMMGFLLLQPSPSVITMIGLGGGSLAKFCFAHVPSARIAAVEINADVIAMRDLFAIPEDGPRFEVIHEDGAAYVAAQKDASDVLLVDGYDDLGIPPGLSSPAFYKDCFDSLRPGGVLVVNLNLPHRQYVRQIALIRNQFGISTVAAEATGWTNMVVFATKGPSGVNLAEHPARPAGLDDAGWTALRASFARIVHAVRERTR